MVNEPTSNAEANAASKVGPPRPQVLSREEILRFHEDGYLGPFTAVKPSVMASIRRRIEEDILGVDRPHWNDCRHLDYRVIFDLVTHPAILDRIESVIGPDVVLWKTAIISKPPGDPLEIAWHQDYKFWPLDPPLNVSAWIAIDEVTADNSCVQLIPGSHTDIVPHLPATKGQKFRLQADPASVDSERRSIWSFDRASSSYSWSGSSIIPIPITHPADVWGSRRASRCHLFGSTMKNFSPDTK